MNLQALEDFTGGWYPFYMLRFGDETDTMDIIATDGYIMCVNVVKISSHNLQNKTIGIEIAELTKIQMFVENGLFIQDIGDNVEIGLVNIRTPLKTIPESKIPKIDVLLNIEPLSTKSNNMVSAQYFKKVLKYCDKIGEEDFTLLFTGDRAPLIFTGDEKRWKIYLMPMESR